MEPSKRLAHVAEVAGLSGGKPAARIVHGGADIRKQPWSRVTRRLWGASVWVVGCHYFPVFISGVTVIPEGTTMVFELPFSANLSKA